MSSNVILALRRWAKGDTASAKIKCPHCDRYICERGMAQHVADKHGYTNSPMQPPDSGPETQNEEQ